MIRRLAAETLWQVPATFQGIYAHGVAIDAPARLLFISGQIGVAADGTSPPDFAGQCRQAMANVETLLAAGGMTTADLVKVTYYLTRADDLPLLTQARAARWRSASPPAVTTLVVAALARPALLVEIEAIAACEAAAGEARGRQPRL